MIFKFSGKILKVLTCFRMFAQMYAFSFIACKTCNYLLTHHELDSLPCCKLSIDSLAPNYRPSEEGAKIGGHQSSHTLLLSLVTQRDANLWWWGLIWLFWGPPIDRKRQSMDDNRVTFTSTDSVWWQDGGSGFVRVSPLFSHQLWQNDMGLLHE